MKKLESQVVTVKTNIEGILEFKDLNFYYEETKINALKNVSQK